MSALTVAMLWVTITSVQWVTVCMGHYYNICALHVLYKSDMILNTDYLKMSLIAVILIVRLGMIFNAQKLVTHMIPQQVQCTQTHHVHTHMIIFHNNLIP